MMTIADQRKRNMKKKVKQMNKPRYDRLKFKKKKKSVDKFDDSSTSSNDTEIEDASMDIDNNISSETEDENQASALGNSNWADAMAKILHGSQNKGILAKAKKETEIHYDKPVETFETVAEANRSNDALKEEVKTKTKDVKPLSGNDFRIKPNITARDKERALARIATKGVVQLFNAVKEQQKIYKTKLKAAGGSERKQEKLMKTVTKSAFLDILKKKSPSIPLQDALKSEETELKSKTDDSTWKILREDFMLGAKMKDWDKESSEEESFYDKSETIS